MSKEIRKVTQYKIYTLIINNDKENKIVGIFDEKKLLDNFVKDSKNKVKTSDYFFQDEWVEIKPKESNFNIPFNPKFVLKKEDTKTKVNTKVAGIDKLKNNKK